MIDGLYGRVTTFECERKVAGWFYRDFQPVDMVMGPWRSKVTIEFDGPIPEWLQRALRENGGCVKVIP